MSLEGGIMDTVLALKQPIVAKLTVMGGTYMAKHHRRINGGA